MQARKTFSFADENPWGAKRRGIEGDAAISQPYNMAARTPTSFAGARLQKIRGVSTSRAPASMSLLIGGLVEAELVIGELYVGSKGKYVEYHMPKPFCFILRNSYR